MVALLSRLLSSALLCIFIFGIPNRALGQSSSVPKFPKGGSILSPLKRLPTDSDRVIRDFVHLLYPNWNDSAWDLVITGKRSMNQNFGVDTWNFAVLDAGQYVIYGFLPSAIPCSEPEVCFGNPPDIAGARLLGRIYQRGSRVYGFVGARPVVSEKNREFQRAAQHFSSEEVESQLRATGARYPPSKRQELVDDLRKRPIFSEYGLGIVSLHFCRTDEFSRSQNLAMFWSAELVSTKFKRSYRLTMEPYEGDVTGFVEVSKAEAAQWKCTP